jgi:hypothetical protein
MVARLTRVLRLMTPLSFIGVTPISIGFLGRRASNRTIELLAVHRGSFALSSPTVQRNDVQAHFHTCRFNLLVIWELAEHPLPV